MDWNPRYHKNMTSTFQPKKKPLIGNSSPTSDYSGLNANMSQICPLLLFKADQCAINAFKNIGARIQFEPVTLPKAGTRAVVG